MKRIDEATLAILSRVTVDGNMIKLTCGQLDRKQYLAVNEILELMGGKWTKKVKAHVFPEAPTDRLESVLLTGEITQPKQYGYFPTPPAIAKLIIEQACVDPGMTVLEPSAGQGGIAEHVPQGCTLDCIELLPDNVAVLERKGYAVMPGDFLEMDVAPLYDRVIMNPPFERQQDIDHVLHALKCLKPGGRLVSIMSAGVLFRDNRKTAEFREMVSSCGRMERLPEGSFLESGTNVNAVMVVMDT